MAESEVLRQLVEGHTALAGKVAGTEGELKRVADSLQKIEHHMHGNGSPGLRTDVHSIKAAISGLERDVGELQSRGKYCVPRREIESMLSKKADASEFNIVRGVVFSAVGLILAAFLAALIGMLGLKAAGLI